MRRLGHQQMTTDTALGSMTKRFIVDRGGSFSPLNVQAVAVPCTSEKTRKVQTEHVDTILASNPRVELCTVIKRRLKEDVKLTLHVARVRMLT